MIWANSILISPSICTQATWMSIAGLLKFVCRAFEVHISPTFDSRYEWMWQTPRLTVTAVYWGGSRMFCFCCLSVHLLRKTTAEWALDYVSLNLHCRNCIYFCRRLLNNSSISVVCRLLVGRKVHILSNLMVTWQSISNHFKHLYKTMHCLNIKVL